jgi:hypothetical protein
MFSFLSVVLYARWRFFTKDKVEKQRHLACNKTVLLYCMYVSWGLDHTILKFCWKYTDSFLSFCFIVLYVCCLLHVAHFVFWITLYNGFFMLYRFSSLFLFYCTLCIFGLHYFIVYLCYAWSSFSFCFIVLNVYFANFNSPPFPFYLINKLSQNNNKKL